MTIRIPANVLIHVWSYDFYDMMLSTGKQRRHMIRPFRNLNNPRSGHSAIAELFFYGFMCKTSNNFAFHRSQCKLQILFD